MNDSERLWKVAQTVYLFMTGAYNLTDTPHYLPVIDSPYTDLISNDLTGEGGAVFKEFNILYDTKWRITDELNLLENSDESEYNEIESLLNMLDNLMEVASIDAFISGYHVAQGIDMEKDLSFLYEELLKKKFSRLNGTKVISYDHVCDCFAAVQERLQRSGTARKASPDLHLMKLAYDMMLRFLIGKAYYYGFTAGTGELPMWYEET